MTLEKSNDKTWSALKTIQSRAQKELPHAPWDNISLDELLQDGIFGADQKEYKPKGRIRRFQEMLSADEDDEGQI